MDKIYHASYMTVGIGMRGIVCPYCKDKDVVKNGFYKYKNNVEQRYKCKSCGKSFTEESKSPFKGMRFSPNVILFAIRLYTEFYLSSNNCLILIKDVMNIKVSGGTILNWIQKFAPYFQRISKIYKPRYSDIWHMDKMFINRVGSRKRPGRIGYLITVYDENRNVIATFLSSKR